MVYRSQNRERGTEAYVYVGESLLSEVLRGFLDGRCRHRMNIVIHCSDSGFLWVFVLFFISMYQV